MKRQTRSCATLHLGRRGRWRSTLGNGRRVSPKVRDRLLGARRRSIPQCWSWRCLPVREKPRYASHLRPIHPFFFSNPIHAGKFIPTRRTPDISTSDLLERIVSGYRKRDFDEKLTKMGHAELRAEGCDYDDSNRSANRRESGSTSPGFPTSSKIEQWEELILVCSNHFSLLIFGLFFVLQIVITLKWHVLWFAVSIKWALTFLPISLTNTSVNWVYLHCKQLAFIILREE